MTTTANRWICESDIRSMSENRVARINDQTWYCIPRKILGKSWDGRQDRIETLCGNRGWVDGVRTKVSAEEDHKLCDGCLRVLEEERVKALEKSDV